MCIIAQPNLGRIYQFLKISISIELTAKIRVGDTSRMASDSPRSILNNRSVSKDKVTRRERQSPT